MPTDDCEHDVVMSSCMKCGKSAKVILCNTFLDKIVDECEKSAILIGDTWYVSLDRIRRFRRWKK